MHSVSRTAGVSSEPTRHTEVAPVSFSITGLSRNNPGTPPMLEEGSSSRLGTSQLSVCARQLSNYERFRSRASVVSIRLERGPTLDAATEAKHAQTHRMQRIHPFNLAVKLVGVIVDIKHTDKCVWGIKAN